MSHDPYEHLDGAYLLGALDEQERAEYEAHLEGCATCRTALAQARTVLPFLAGTDEHLLDDLPADAAVLPPLPDTVLPALLAAAQRTRRRRRTLMGALGGLAAACVIALTLAVTTLTGGGTPAGTPMTALRPSLVNAEVALQPTDWGTEIHLTCWYRSGASAPAGYRYSLVVRDNSGETHQLGNWQLTPGQRITFTSGTALTTDQISEIDLTDATGTPLLTLAE